MNIVKAGAFSNEAGVIVDSFHFTDVFHTLELNPSEKDRFLANLHDVVAQKISVQQLLEARRHLNHPANIKVEVQPRLVFDSESSSHSTLLQVVAQDLPGLLRHMQSYAEVWGHLRGELDTPAKYEAHRLQLAQKIWKELKANDSAECRSCHTPAAMAFAQQPPEAASAHKSLATSGMTCIDCHPGVAHTLPQGG